MFSKRIIKNISVALVFAILLSVVTPSATALLAALVGVAVVECITNDFMTWGLKEGCKAYKKYGPIKSFCKANGYI